MKGELSTSRPQRAQRARGERFLRSLGDMAAFSWSSRFLACLRRWRIGCQITRSRNVSSAVTSSVCSIADITAGAVVELFVGHAHNTIISFLDSARILSEFVTIATSCSSPTGFEQVAMFFPFLTTPIHYFSRKVFVSKTTQRPLHLVG